MIHNDQHWLCVETVQNIRLAFSLGILRALPTHCQQSPSSDGTFTAGEKAMVQLLFYESGPELKISGDRSKPLTQ